LYTAFSKPDCPVVAGIINYIKVAATWNFVSSANTIPTTRAGATTVGKLRVVFRKNYKKKENTSQK
jgi:hypothetical protein